MTSGLLWGKVLQGVSIHAQPSMNPVIQTEEVIINFCLCKSQQTVAVTGQNLINQVEMKQLLTRD